MTTPTTSDFERSTRIRDERDQLRNRLASFGRLLDAAEKGGASVMRIDDVRRALKLGARR